MSGTALVTGANGFIGRALCARLACEGGAVRAAVYPAGAPVPVGTSAAPVGAIDGGTDWSAALAGVSVVVHLAARVHVLRETEAEPLEAFRRVNVEGTRRLARAAAAAGVKRLVFLSTVGVHGASSETSLTEDSPLRPHNDYSRSKLEAERALAEAARGTSLETVIVRAPLVYGPGNKGNMDRLISAVRRDWPLPLASVRNRRSFICVDNLVDALLACAAHPAAAGKVFLVSDGRDLSTPELVRELCAGLGRPARLFPFPSALLRLIGAGLTDSLAVDVGRIRRELGWAPRVAAVDGLRAAAAACREGG